MVADIFEDFQPPSKKFLATPLQVIEKCDILKTNQCIVLNQPESKTLMPFKCLHEIVILKSGKAAQSTPIINPSENEHPRSRYEAADGLRVCHTNVVYEII